MQPQENETAGVPGVTDDTFESEVLQAAGPTLVDFGAAWCGPCVMVGPIVEQVAQGYAGRLKVVKMDVDANPNTPQRLGIMSIPALILFRGGTEVTRLIGFRPREALIEALSPYIE